MEIMVATFWETMNESCVTSAEFHLNSNLYKNVFRTGENQKR